MIYKFAKEDIINGFNNLYSLSNSRTYFGINECLTDLNKFININLKNCKSYTENRTLVSDMNMAKVDEIVCSANDKENDEKLKKFILSLKESNDFSRLINLHLLNDYNHALFKEEIKKSLEYHHLKTDILNESKLNKSIKKSKV